MRKMNWTHSSSLALGTLLVVALATVGTVSAVSFSDDDVPTEAQVGTETEFTVTMDDPFENQPNSWTVRAETGLENATVTVRTDTAAGIVTETGDQTARLPINRTDGVSEVTVEVNGDVPAIEGYSYENRGQENVTALRVAEQGGATLERWNLHRFTRESREARQAIDNASAALEGTDNSDAEERLDEAITFYNNGNFEQATTAAEDAEDMAGGSGNSQQVLLIAGLAVVLVVLVGGGIYAWQSRQQDTSKLR
jgi:flagellar basal body-associated protein FliL